MVFRTFTFILLMLLFACNSQNQDNISCQYRIDDLYRDSDSVRLERFDFTDKGKVDILEKKNDFGNGGIYSFDNTGQLRFYAFLVSENKDYYFSLEYDSSGHEIRRTGREVVRWYLKDYKDDSLKVTFLLYSLHQQYKNIMIKNDDFELIDIGLDKSQVLSNIVGKVVALPKNKGTFYIKGTRINTCTGQANEFIDSLNFSTSLLK